MNILESVHSDTKTWRCDCGCSNFATIDIWDLGDGSGYGYVNVEGRDEPDLLERLKAAWRMLRGEKYVSVEVLLTRKIAREMIAALTPIATPDTTVKNLTPETLTITGTKNVRVVA